MSRITIYNDGTKDAQVVVLNHLTNKPAESYALPLQNEGEREPVSIELGNGDIIMITLADSPPA